MKATETQQADLLGLANLDLEITRSRAAIKNLSSGAQFATLRETQRGLATKLIDARNSLDSVELELMRAATDLELVEQRIAKDVARLNTTNNSKDAQGIQSEIESLSRRKSDLEDIELAILDQQEAAKAVYATVSVDKAAVDDELASAEAANEAELMKLRSGLDLLSNDRSKQASRISTELNDLYEKKAARGLAVAKLLGRECGACRISLGATAFNELESQPRDELVTCPECQAILIR
ncbi:MAG: zinc ribbon domain-containing protein [Rhodoluna sp.]